MSSAIKDSAIKSVFAGFESEQYFRLLFGTTEHTAFVTCVFVTQELDGFDCKCFECDLIIDRRGLGDNTNLSHFQIGRLIGLSAKGIEIVKRISAVESVRVITPFAIVEQNGIALFHC